MSCCHIGPLRSALSRLSDTGEGGVGENVGELVKVPAAAWTFSPYAPTVSGGASVSPPVAAWEWAAYPPAISISALVEVPAAAWTWTAYGPSIITGASVQVPCAEWTWAAYEPTIEAGAGVELLESFATTSTTGTTTRTFANVTVSASRTHVIIGLAARSNPGPTAISAVTANGVSCTKIDAQANGPNQVEMWACEDNTGGTTLTVVATYSINPDIAIGMAGISVNGLNSLTPTSSGKDATDPLATSVDVDAGGVAFYIAMASTPTLAFTPSGVTERHDSTMTGTFGSLSAYSMGADVFASAQVGLSIGADATGGTALNPCFVGASFR